MKPNQGNVEYDLPEDLMASWSEYLLAKEEYIKVLKSYNIT